MQTSRSPTRASIRNLKNSILDSMFRRMDKGQNILYRDKDIVELLNSSASLWLLRRHHMHPFFDWKSTLWLFSWFRAGVYRNTINIIYVGSSLVGSLHIDGGGMLQFQSACIWAKKLRCRAVSCRCRKCIIIRFQKQCKNTAYASRAAYCCSSSPNVCSVAAARCA